MRNQFPTIGLAIALCPFVGCFAPAERIPPKAREDEKKQGADAAPPPFTGEIARAALADMLPKLKGEGKYFVAMRGMGADEFAALPIEPSLEGWIFAGPFQVNLEKRTYDVIFPPGKKRAGDYFAYHGQFEFHNGRWTASEPKLVEQGHISGVEP